MPRTSTRLNEADRMLIADALRGQATTNRVVARQHCRDAPNITRGLTENADRLEQLASRISCYDVDIVVP